MDKMSYEKRINRQREFAVEMKRRNELSKTTREIFRDMDAAKRGMEEAERDLEEARRNYLIKKARSESVSRDGIKSAHQKFKHHRGLLGGAERRHFDHSYNYDENRATAFDYSDPKALYMGEYQNDPWILDKHL
jgi:transcriptional/translational regulatory protein YebC/TACO1